MAFHLTSNTRKGMLSGDFLISDPEFAQMGVLITNNVIYRIFATLSNNELAIYDLFNNKYLLYHSKLDDDFKAIYRLGLTEQKSPDFFYKHLKKDDYQFVKNTIDETVKFLQTKKAEERMDYMLMMDVTLKHTNGIYYRLMHQSVVMNSISDNEGWIVICLLSLIDKSGEYTEPLRQLVYMPKNENCLFCHTKDPTALCFTKTEKKVIRLIAQGYDYIEIAEAMHISPNTANNHMAHIKQKVRLNKNPQLVYYAKTIGVI